MIYSKGSVFWYKWMLQQLHDPLSDLRAPIVSFRIYIAGFWDSDKE